jgi:hypothetical protein
VSLAGPAGPTVWLSLTRLTMVRWVNRAFTRATTIMVTIWEGRGKERMVSVAISNFVQGTMGDSDEEIDAEKKVGSRDGIIFES